MLDIINEIVQLDKTAKDMVKNARFDRDQILAHAKEEEDILKSSLLEREKARLEKVRQHKDELFAEKKAELEKMREDISSDLTAKFEQNENLWIEQALESITTPCL